MTRKAVARYSGELAKRLPHSEERAIGEAVASGDVKAFRRQLNAQQERKAAKLKLLLAHFGIDEGRTAEERCSAYQELALRLAEEHVPGFQVASQRGAPKKWTWDLRFKAALAFDRLAAEYPGELDTKLAKMLYQDEKWKAIAKSPGALLKQIRLLHAEASALAQEAFARELRGFPGLG